VVGSETQQEDEEEESTSGEQGPPARSERTNTAGLARQNSKKLHDSILTDSVLISSAFVSM